MVIRYEYIAFNDLSQMVSYLSAAFIKKLGLTFGTRMGICAMNRTEWNMCDYAGHTQGFITTKHCGEKCMKLVYKYK